MRPNSGAASCVRTQSAASASSLSVGASVFQVLNVYALGSSVDCCKEFEEEERAPPDQAYSQCSIGAPSHVVG